MLTATLEQIYVAGRSGRPRIRPERVIADKGYPSKANRAWLRARGIAMRSDKTARNYHAALCLAATLHWLNTLQRQVLVHSVAPSATDGA
jgi:hypothetical protein